MINSSFNSFVKSTNKKAQVNKPKPQGNGLDTTLKGFLLNTYIKKDCITEDCLNFDNISSSLFIPEQSRKKEEAVTTKQSAFDIKKVLKPLAITTGITVASIIGISAFMKGYSNSIAKTEGFAYPSDLARNINILEEPHFAMYRALREPNSKNVLGLGAVGIMSAFTLSAKNFIEGVKEVWIKKQNCDIDYDFQENMIDVEAKAFSGKLNVVNNLLSDTTQYFKSVLSGEKPQKQLSFLGDKKENRNIEKENKAKKYLILGAIGVGFVGLSYFLFRNIQKTTKNLDDFYKKYQDTEIRAKIQQALNLSDKEQAKISLSNIFKTINAKEETMQKNFSQLGLSQEEIQSAINDVKSAQIFAQAPEALGGISEKIQYYFYINEERGHLYNWVLNPENKFNKFLFLSFSTISALGYLAKTSAEAIKEVAVARENSKNDLNLKKRLVDVEINNFKTKKISAIQPMIDTFNSQVQKGKSKEELKAMAENILIEIKNGPPYVYN